MSQDRRNFLKHVGTGAAAAAAVAKLSETSANAQEATATVLSSARSGSPIKLALELDGEFAGWLSSVEGGSVYADVIETTDDSGRVKKHIGGVKYEDITVKCGTGMSKNFFEWISDTFASKHTRKNGAVVAADYDYNTMAVTEFSQALISEVGFPAMDAGSKDAAKLTLKFAPEFIRSQKGDGSKIQGDFGSKQKTWLPSNFRLTIDGLDKASSRVSKIEALTFKQKIIENTTGETRDYLKEPGKLEFPNIKITLSEEYSHDLFAWHEDFVIKGENGEDKEKTGLLEFLDPTRQKVLLALEFKHLGIFKYESARTTDGNKIPTIKAEMYCEEIAFKLDPKQPPILIEEQ